MLTIFMTTVVTTPTWCRSCLERLFHVCENKSLIVETTIFKKFHNTKSSMPLTASTLPSRKHWPWKLPFELLSFLILKEAQGRKDSAQTDTAIRNSLFSRSLWSTDEVSRPFLRHPKAYSLIFVLIYQCSMKQVLGRHRNKSMILKVTHYKIS